MTIDYDVNTFISTHTAMTFLRSTLATRVFHELAVIEIPTGEGLCGFLVLDKTLDEAIWSGHTFRENGRGGAGHGRRKMSEIFAALGVYVKCYDRFAVSEEYPALCYDINDLRDVETKILFLAGRLVRELGEDGYHVPANQPIMY